MWFGPPDVDMLFRPGARLRRRDGAELSVEVVDVGLLHLPTGRLVAVDPYLLPSMEDFAVPFTVTAAPGSYPVSLSLARRPGPRRTRSGIPMGRVAAVKLTISDATVVAWELALKPGEDPAWLRPREIPGFVVDSGTGSFLDASAVPGLSRLGDPGPEWDDDSELDKVGSEILDRAAVNLVVDPVSGLNAVLFSCGLGDGVYPTWVGQTSTGEPACFVADLEL